MLRLSVLRCRKPPGPKANWLRKCAFLLDFATGTAYNGDQAGTPVLTHRTPPNQDGGVRSIMISTIVPPTAHASQLRKTYPQDWPAYNAAQVAEKSTFMRLLADVFDHRAAERNPARAA